MLIRVYALYNRGSFVLWTMGAFLVLSIILNVILVCRITIARADRFNALFQRWLGVVQDDVPKDAPPPPRCVPYRSFQECVFFRTFLRYIAILIEHVRRPFASQRTRSVISSSYRPIPILTPRAVENSFRCCVDRQAGL